MKKIVLYLLLLSICISLCACQGQGLDKNSQTYKSLMAAIEGPTATPGPTQDPTEANIQAFKDAVAARTAFVDVSSLYKEYARNPSSHENESIMFNGIVKTAVGVMGWDYLIAVNGSENELFYVGYSKTRLLPGDSVRVSGLFMGEESIKGDDGAYAFYPRCAASNVEILN